MMIACLTCRGSHSVLELVFLVHSEFEVVVCLVDWIERDPFTVGGDIFSRLEDERFGSFQNLLWCDGYLPRGGEFLAIFDLLEKDGHW